MTVAVFISDLHLHPEDKILQSRFDQFILWAASSVKTVYILGDFFHAWAGDDALDDWSLGIAKQLKSLAEQGISLFYMSGNRDFLLGKAFAKQAGFTLLMEPTVISLGQEQVLLAHGDGYCIEDKAHQWFRFLTRNRLFRFLFLSLPLAYRKALVSKVRTLSQSKPKSAQMAVSAHEVIKDLAKHKATTLIHGHTHRQDLIHYQLDSEVLKRYVLSDWDDNPVLLCYDHTKRFYLKHLSV